MLWEPTTLVRFSDEFQMSFSPKNGYRPSTPSVGMFALGNASPDTPKSAFGTMRLGLASG